MARSSRKPGKLAIEAIEALRKSERFPITDPNIAFSVDGAPNNEGTYVLRICVHEISSPEDMRRIADWLKKVIMPRMPKGHKCFKGYGEHKVN